MPDNPNGTYYGLIDQNTPVRILARPLTNTGADAFGRTSSSGWGSADTGGAWTTAGGSASDFSVAAASGGRHLHTAASTRHTSRLAASILRSDQTVSIRVNALSTGASQSAGLVFRRTTSTDFIRAELLIATDATITARVVQTDASVDTLRGTKLTALTHSIATWYRLRVQVGDTSVRVKVWVAGTTEPATWNLDGADGLSVTAVTAGTGGPTSMRESSNTNANATVDFDDYVLTDGPVIRFTGHVDAWPTTWTDESERQPLAQIQASGRLRIVGQARSLKSAAFRASTQNQWSGGAMAAGYWPMEDASQATSFASGISGGSLMSFSDMRPAADSDVQGSDPLPIGGGGAVFTASVGSYAASTEWAVRALMRFPDVPLANTGVLAWTTGGTIDKWALVLTTGSTWTIQGYTAGTEVLAASFQNFIDGDGGSLLGRQIYMVANAVQSGGNISYSVYLYTDGGSVALGVTGSYAGTVGNVSKIFHSAYPGLTDGGYTIGHVGASGDTTWAAAGALIANGYSMESTAERFDRLLAEENLPGYFGEIAGAGAGTTEQLMGAQSSASLIQQLREVEATEEGILFDGLQGQLTLLPRTQRQNHSVDLTLDHDQFQLGSPFEPIRDDFLLRNDVTASNASGSTARASDLAGIIRWGVYSDPININVSNDAETPQHATWRLNLGKTPQTRYPGIVLQLTDPRNVGLIDDWLSCDIGSRLQLQNLLYAPDGADLLIEGYTEELDSSIWTVTINTSPAQPWSVFTFEDTDLGRLNTAGSTLLNAYAAADTTMLVATPSNQAVWSTTAEPYNWAVAGEKIRVDTMTTNAAAFVNAGTAAHADNATVAPALPASVTKGDLLLVFCAIRNTAATITTPTGYTALLSDGNVALFGKIHTGTESAPTVAFSGGSAGDTTSAQTAAFRYTQNVVTYSASSSNVSAQNIAVPAMLPPLHRCVALWLGWKQDDWTSVATYAGTEIGEPSTTTGSDQGLVWDYQIQTTATETAAGSFTVTGGANAISKGYVVMLAGDVQTATVTRARNGVSKAQAQSASVQLWKPGVLAL